MPDDAVEYRILFLAPTARDGRITQQLLADENLTCHLCENVGRLIEQTRRGVAVILMTDDAIKGGGIEELLSALAHQPAWSDVPIVMLIRQEPGAIGLNRVIQRLTNVTLLERPAPIRSITSAVKAALRGRLRQYQLRQILEREQAARRELEASSQMKDEFLATLSHELRTPLNAILGWSQLIRAAGLDAATVEEGLPVIERNARIQVQLIEDLLDMSRIISGKMRLDIQTISAASFVDAAIATVSPGAEAKGIRLERRYAPDAGQLNGDAARLQQVAWNLLSNAIKFTPPGGRVRVSLRREASQLVLQVSDSGNGIAPDFLPHVFERFRQADASTTRSYGGLGLGLAIVKNLVELHGGTITAESAGAGQGSTFTVKLPAALPPERADRAFPPDAGARPLDRESISLKGLRILLVDDEPDSRQLVKRLLEDRGSEVMPTASAEEAIERFSAARPNLLISDVAMPVTDGYELLRKIRILESHASRDRPRTNGQTSPDSRGDRPIPAIALTAFARTEDRARSRLAGYAVHLAKPVEPAKLLIAVARLMGRLKAEPRELDGPAQRLSHHPTA